MEELEAVDWYNQRVDACKDSVLKGILAHNRDEEKEHAAMTLEWLRRHDPVLDRELRTYLFTTGPVLAVEEESMGGGDAEGGENDGGGGAEGPGSDVSDGSLGIGSLKGLTE
jgi:hypothetical protein